MLYTFLGVAILPLLSNAVALPEFAPKLVASSIATTAYTQQVCKTFVGRKSTQVFSYTTGETLVLHPKARVTYTPSTTVTPSTTTLTASTTLTGTVTASVITDTYTITPTDTETSYTTTTITETDTESDTSTLYSTTTSTTTVNPPDGFIYPTPTLGGKKLKRDLMVRRPAPEVQKRANGLALPNYKQPKSPVYAQKVVCLRIVESIVPYTKTATATSTTTYTASTPSTTVTQTFSATSTVTLPDANVTITAPDSTTTTTSMVTVTTTTTTTTVFTVSVTVTATATYYAACGPQNLVSMDPSGGLLTLSGFDYSTATYQAIDSTYDCCVACLTSPNCAGSTSYSNSGNLYCAIINLGTCPANQNQQAYMYASYDSGETNTFSNGLCGYGLYVSS